MTDHLNNHPRIPEIPPSSSEGEGINCPSCGRYVGAYDTCPYCQASLESRLSLRIVKWIAIAGSILGLILLWFGVRYREVPLVKIGTMELQHNMAIVRIEGRVIDLKLDPVKNSFRIVVDDGTGRASLNGYGKLALFEKILSDQFPQMGDEISAIGNISVSESWGITMFMSSPRRLHVLSRTEITDLKIGSIQISDTGLQGWVSGKITGTRDFKSGFSADITDSSGTIALTVFNSELEKYPSSVQKALRKTGTPLRFRCKIDNYKGRMQLRLVEPGNLENMEIANLKDEGKEELVP